MTPPGQEHAIPGDCAGPPATMTCLGPGSRPVPGASPPARPSHPARRARVPHRHPTRAGFPSRRPAAGRGFLHRSQSVPCGSVSRRTKLLSRWRRWRVPARRLDRPALLFLSGQAVSVLGDGLAVLAIPLMVLELTRNPLLSGLSAASVTVGYLLVGLPAGVLVDRLDPWRVLIAMDAARALLFAALYALSAAGVLRIWALFVLGAVRRGLCGVLRVRPGRGGQGSVRRLRPDGRELRARAGQPDLADRRSRDRGTARRGRRDQPGPAG